MRFGAILLTVTVIFQFLLELTLGRIFVAPGLLAFVLVYLTVNHGTVWAVDGAFWSGLCLDLLLHQPPGATSLALLVGLYAARIVGRISAGEGRSYLLSMTATASVLSDALYMVTATRPFGAGFNAHLLYCIPRGAVTVILGVLLLEVAQWLEGFRTRRVSA